MFNKIILASAALALLALAVSIDPAFAAKCSAQEIQEIEHKKVELFRDLEEAKKHGRKEEVKNIEREMERVSKMMRGKCE